MENPIFSIQSQKQANGLFVSLIIAPNPDKWTEEQKSSFKELSDKSVKDLIESSFNIEEYYAE